MQWIRTRNFSLYFATISAILATPPACLTRIAVAQQETTAPAATKVTAETIATETTKPAAVDATTRTVINALPQGDFEKSDDGKTPSGWRFPVPEVANKAADGKPIPGPKIEPTQEVKWVEETRDGKTNHYILIKSRIQQTVTLGTDLALDPTWKRLKISTRLRAKDLKRGPDDYMNARISLKLLDEQDKALVWPRAPELDSDADWTSLSNIVDLPPAARHLRISAGLYGSSGEMAIDDIVVEPNPPAEGSSVEVGFEDGMFEDLMTDGYPKGWNFLFKRYTKIVEEDGNHYLHFDNSTVPGGYYIAEKRYKLNPTWKKLQVKVLMRAKNLENDGVKYHGARLYCRFQDANGNDMEQGWVQALCLTTDSDWVELQGPGIIPDGAAFIVVQTGLAGSTGTADFDNIRIEFSPPVDEP